VTRHGTALACYEGEWNWRAGTSDGDPCVDEGEWPVKGGVVATVCRDGAWRQEFLENPTPTPTASWSRPGPGRIPHPWKRLQPALKACQVDHAGPRY